MIGMLGGRFGRCRRFNISDCWGSTISHDFGDGFAAPRTCGTARHVRSCNQVKQGKGFDATTGPRPLDFQALCGAMKLLA
jgi:hypothetical protein